jgi:ribosomal protein S18 acetylase RimI-like enzyme
MLIRALTSDDARSFQSLRLSGLQEAPASFASSYEDEKDGSHDEFAERLTANEDRAVLGAFEHDRLVGIAGVRREGLRKYRHKVILWGVYVDPGSRGTGVSRMLLTEAINFARKMPGVTQVNLTVTAGNAIAIQLYRLLGFNEFGHEPNSIFADGTLHDELYMSLLFSAP